MPSGRNRSPRRSAANRDSWPGTRPVGLPPRLQRGRRPLRPDGRPLRSLAGGAIHQPGALHAPRFDTVAAHRVDRSRGDRHPNRPRRRTEGGPAGRRATDDRLDSRRAGRDRRERPDVPGRSPMQARRQGFIWISASIAGRSPAIAAANACWTCSVSPAVFRSTRPGRARPRPSASTARRRRSSWLASTRR